MIFFSLKKNNLFIMKILTLIIFLFLFPILNAQELLSTLVSNPILIVEKQFPIKNKSTITLPFFDDFSYNECIVNPNLWIKSSVFVNRTYPINPVTIGVATFDGLNEYGLARNFLQTNSSAPSDTLLSQEIDVSSVNTAYLMFYFQAKGIGDAPQYQDKLVLEFLNDTLGWEQIWFSYGQSMQEFDKVVEVIDEPRFLHSSFQFRFRNYATISGNFDHWHIDYIRLDELLSMSDTTELNDVSFVYNIPSFLKRYEQMPWLHFKNFEDTELKDSLDVILRNNHSNIFRTFKYDLFENNIWNPQFPLYNGGYNGPYELEINSYSQIGNYYLEYPNAVSIDEDIFDIITTNNILIDSVSFHLKFIASHQFVADYNLMNDTIFHVQHFNSSFAYDDGVAESAYGISNVGAKLAYQFKINYPDTLRAVQMYFPQMLNSVDHIPFELTIWKDNLGLPGDIIYTQTVYPVHTTNGNFHTYIIDEPQAINLTTLGGNYFYVGWEQQTNDLLNIGLDKNGLANQYMFYNIGSGWNNSIYPGAWMIRPLVSRNESVLFQEDIKIDDFKIYPNPVKDELNVILSTTENIISIYNLQGKLLKKSFFSTSNCKLNINDLSSGMYVVEVRNDNVSNFQKFIIEENGRR